MLPKGNNLLGICEADIYEYIDTMGETERKKNGGRNIETRIHA